MQEQQDRVVKRTPAPFSFGICMLLAASFFERLSYYGLTNPFMNYLQNAPGDPTRPGAIGLGQSKAVIVVYVFTILVYALPLVGAAIGDNWLGRYRTATSSVCIYMIGEAVLLDTSLLEDSQTDGKLGGFCVASVLIAMGVGGTKPNLSALLGDQLEDPRVESRKTVGSELVLEDQTLTHERVYALNYWLINAGALAGVVTTILERYTTFWLAFLLPICSLACCLLALLFSGNRLYKPEVKENVLPTAARALLDAMRHGFSLEALKAPADGGQDRGPDGTPYETSMISGLQDSLRVIRVFLPLVVSNLSYDQMSTNMISQALQMERGGMPNDILFNLNPLFVMILMPVWDNMLLPVLRKRYRLGPITRIALGFAFATLAMANELGAQILIYSRGPCYGYPLECEHPGPNHVNVALLVPTYFFLAISEIFMNVAGMEYAYTKAPSSMKSLLQAMFAFMWALGAILGIALAPLSRNPYMTVLFGILCGSLVLTTVLFPIVFQDEPSAATSDYKDTHGQGESQRLLEDSVVEGI